METETHRRLYSLGSHHATGGHTEYVNDCIWELYMSFVCGCSFIYFVVYEWGLTFWMLGGISCDPCRPEDHNGHNISSCAISCSYLDNNPPKGMSNTVHLLFHRDLRFEKYNDLTVFKTASLLLNAKQNPMFPWEDWYRETLHHVSYFNLPCLFENRKK